MGNSAPLNAGPTLVTQTEPFRGTGQTDVQAPYAHLPSLTVGCLQKTGIGSSGSSFLSASRKSLHSKEYQPVRMASESDEDAENCESEEDDESESEEDRESAEITVNHTHLMDRNAPDKFAHGD